MLEGREEICDCVLEQVAGENRGESVTVFVKRMLERVDDRK